MASITASFHKVWWLMLLIAVTLLMFGCSDGGNSSEPTATVNGVVADSSAVPIDGATVTGGGQTITTGADGKFTLTIPVSSRAVSISKATYVTTGTVVTVAAGQTCRLNVTLQKVGRVVAIADTTVASSVVDARTDGLNASVDFPADSFVNGSGARVAAANVAITTVLLKDAGFANSFPGLFMGTQTGAPNAVPIESYGYVDVDLTGAGGAKLLLAPGKTATLTIPVDPANDPLDATIPLWSLDTATGIWKQEGVATRSAAAPFVYTATVSHFSPYNLDKPVISTGPLEITVVEQDGTTPVPGVTVTVQTYNAGTSGLWKGTGISGADGKLTITIPQAGNPNITARIGDRSGFAGVISGGKVTIAMQAPLVYAPMTVTVIDSASGAVAGAQVIVNFEGAAGFGEVGRGTTGADGKFVISAPNTFLMIKASKGALTGSGFWQPGSTGPATATVTIN